MERERKYQANKKLREQREKDEEESSLDHAQHKKKGQKQGGEKEGENESDEEQDSQPIDMRREDAELEKILRDYNNEAKFKSKKRETLIDRPFDLPFYKGI